MNPPTQSGQFAVRHDESPKETLLCGFASYGLSGLTAVDFLIDQLELVETGHVTTEAMPSITPFENGRPTHHTRLFSKPELEMTLLKNELFVPPVLSGPFGESILEWTERHGVQEIAIVDAVPMRHGPDDHRTYHVATDDYLARRLGGVPEPPAAGDESVPLAGAGAPSESTEQTEPVETPETPTTPMARGYLDGVTGALVEKGIDSSLAVGVFQTPVHQQLPDVEASIRLIEALNDIYGLGVDTEPLQEFADEIERYYTELAERYEAATEREEAFENRMYM
ncbi:hypothetical protein JCM30237_00240 [Halolamina litorea]|uniref:Proteasome assembly chaperone family protein n=1 Tax=Halolamina litorea TaxID=1515593 RepID=A0ABD6BRP0_9EURY|nr:PAC2 family protein [Halolamina litorea]